MTLMSTPSLLLHCSHSCTCIRPSRTATDSFSLKPTKMLIILLWTKDQLSEDALLKSAGISLRVKCHLNQVRANSGHERQPKGYGRGWGSPKAGTPEAPVGMSAFTPLVATGEVLPWSEDFQALITHSNKSQNHLSQEFTDD